MSVELISGSNLAYSLLQSQLGNVELELLRNVVLCELFSDSFRSFLEAHTSLSRTARDLVPFMSKTFSFTEKILDEGDETMQACWRDFLASRSALPLVSLRHKAMPAELDFELCLAACDDVAVRIHEIRLLDGEDQQELDRVVQAIQRIDRKALGCVVSHDVLAAVLAAQKTACVYARTLSGEIVGYLYGVQVDVPDSPDHLSKCFYIVSTAREPEYGGRHLLQQFLEKGRDLGQEMDSPFHADFVAWAQAQDNIADTQAMRRCIKDGNGVRIEGGGMTEVGEEPCVRQIVRLTDDKDIPFPSVGDAWDAVASYYRQEAGIVKTSLEYLKHRVQGWYYSWRYRNVAVEE